ncbi:iron uptake porin [Allocoleopsis sp.]|uniref:iron uptake porin n=1 Tax=Allocoleopsis sp. TaxID=3088169 RepID=UPI002FD40B80
MKSCLSFEKTASSALIFATLSCLVANFSPAQASSAISTTTADVAIESSKQEFPASKDFSTVTETAELAPITNPPVGVALANPKEESVITTPTEDMLVEETQAPVRELAVAPATNPSTPTEDILVETAQPKVRELTVAPATNPPTQPEISLTNIETAASSTDSSSETKVKDITTQPPLQAQSLPTEEVNESVSPAVTTLDPIEGAEVDDSMEQVTNVTQLSDVRPTDWAYEALRSLVERYGCIAGYPDRSFRGNRAMTRYEFAAGLNSCLQQIERLIAGTGSDRASKQDLETLRRLVSEFQSELTALGTRVDQLEGRTAFMEDHQFSTTTKLFGQAIFGAQGRSENQFNLFLDRQSDPGTNINLVDNVQLSLFTQFSPRSLLLTGLAAGNGNDIGTPLENYVALGYQSGVNNNLQVSDLNFRQLIGSKFALIFGPVGVDPVDVFRGVNRVESAGQGPLSRFAQRNPIINIGGRGAGIGFDWQIASRMSLQGVYSANFASDPFNGGIFGGNEGSTTAGAQLVVSPTDNIDVSLQYINNYSPSGNLFTGVGDSVLAVQQFNSSGFLRAPMNTNAVGLSLEWRVSPRFTVGGWGGYTTSDFKGGSGNVETVNWMAFLNFPDLLGEGNLAGIYVGQPPKITSSDLPAGRNLPNFIQGNFAASPGGQPDTTLHLEGFYRIRVTNNISVTPGVMVIFNPNHNENNDTITVGALRTTFTF